MLPGTSPAIAVLPSGNWVVAWQANTNDLFTYMSSGATENTTQAVLAGTTPALAVLPDGAWVIAYQSGTNDLYIYTSAGSSTNTTLDMLAGTSPAIAAPVITRPKFPG
jgi:hypothetical protein